MQENKLMTVSELADYLNVKPGTIMYWIQTGRMKCPYYKLNGQKSYRFKREDVINMLEQVKTENGENNE